MVKNFAMATDSTSTPWNFPLGQCLKSIFCGLIHVLPFWPCSYSCLNMILCSCSKICSAICEVKIPLKLDLIRSNRIFFLVCHGTLMHQNLYLDGDLHLKTWQPLHQRDVHKHLDPRSSLLLATPETSLAMKGCPPVLGLEVGGIVTSLLLTPNL